MTKTTHLSFTIDFCGDKIFLPPRGKVPAGRMRGFFAKLYLFCPAFFLKVKKQKNILIFCSSTSYVAYAPPFFSENGHPSVSFADISPIRGATSRRRKMEYLLNFALLTLTNYCLDFFEMYSIFYTVFLTE